MSGCFPQGTRAQLAAVVMWSQIGVEIIPKTHLGPWNSQNCVPRGLKLVFSQIFACASTVHRLLMWTKGRKVMGVTTSRLSRR